ncbi:pro-neuregulin-1, membrane-bound isoform 2-T2 [Polymixia lowei]
MSDKRKGRHSEAGIKNSKKDKDSPTAAPKLKVMKSVEVVEGKRATLKCEAKVGNPVPEIKMYKEGVELTSSQTKLKDAHFRKKKKGRVLEYKILKAGDSHFGSYTCEASNSHGKDSTVANVTLRHAASSTTPAAKTSSHMMRCSDSQKNYCVNGGDCYTLEVTPGSPKLLCRCLQGYTGNRCQETVPKRIMNPKPEELYQKRVLTITGICIALLVVGIMCVVAYCKTKNQRKKLHDRLRKSLQKGRNNMASMSNGPQISNSPRENVQLVNKYVCKNAMPAQHVTEKETETSFSTTQYTTSAHQSTTITHTSSQSWSNGRSESVLSESRSMLVTSPAENTQHALLSHRGRLNAIGGTKDLSAYLKYSRDAPDTARDSPYSERYMSAVTSPTWLSPMHLASPVTPESPPSEMSAPLSSLATSVPSMAVSPSGEEEQPLLFASPLRPCNKPSSRDHNQHKRNSAHYNHGHEAHSSPPSPLMIMEHDNYQITHDHEIKAEAPPQNLPLKLANTNSNNNGYRVQTPKANGHVVHSAESNGDSISDGNSSESETEDEPVGEDTPFLSIQNTTGLGLDTPLSVRSMDSSRTNPAPLLSPKDNLQDRLSSINQDPVAVYSENEYRLKSLSKK